MRFVSFNPYRTLGIAGARYIKPEDIFRHQQDLRNADWILFPESWQVNSLAYGLKKRIFPSLSTYHLGYDKVEMTRALWAVAPENVPFTRILPSSENSLEQILEGFCFPMVAKEVRNSMGRGVFLVENRTQLRHYAEKNSVLYIQEYLPIDRDLRVVFVGDQVIAAYWRIGAEGAFLNNVSRGGDLCFEEIPPAALELVAATARTLGIDHAGFDIAVVDGHLYFFEFNPLFGNEGLQRLGIRVEPFILDYLRSLTQIPPERPGPPLRHAV